MRDRSPIWIGLADLLLCVVSVVIVAVNPIHAKTDGVAQKAEFLISADWPVTRDDDADLWLLPPNKRPVSYMSRDVGCAKLDSDNRGFMDGRVRLADGTITTVESNKETISLRCIEPGHYDIAVNLYAAHEAGADGGNRHDLALPVHVEITAINPEVHTVYSKDIILNSVHETINVESFDLDRDGKITLADPPLTLVTDAFYRRNTSTIP